MDAAEAELANALVAMVGAAGPPFRRMMYCSTSHFYHVEAHQVWVCRSNPDDFLLIFSKCQLVDCVLVADLPADAPFLHLFCHWRQ
jgi:hypothetical protein